LSISHLTPPRIYPPSLHDALPISLLAEINPELAGAELDHVARVVGTGAVVFANLASQRDKDVAFEWDRVTALQGDSGPYIQYSRSEEHTSELQSRSDLVCRLLLEK